MYLLRRIAVALLLIWLVACQTSDQPSPAFAAGQIWSVKSSPIQVVVGDVAPWRGRTVVHVSLVGPLLPPHMEDTGKVVRVSHLAFELAALAGSVDRLIVTDAPIGADFVGRYRHWKQHVGVVHAKGVVDTVAEIFDTKPPRAN